MPTLVGEVPDADGPVLASALWDRDGGGPLPPVAVVGGAFRAFGNVTSRGLAVYDPSSRACSSVGSGVTAPAPTAPQIAAIGVLPNNDLVVGGTFTGIDGLMATNIARWNGNFWQPLGAGVAFNVAALTVLPNGDLVAAGTGPAGAPVVQRWNGTAWSDFGTGLTGSVRCLAVSPNGDLLAGGDNLLTGGFNLARWDGAAWSPYGGVINGSVIALLALPGGDMLVAGAFLTAGGAPIAGVARFDGTSWFPLGTGIQAPVWSLTRLANGDIIAAGQFFAAGGAPVNQIARWDGGQWSALGEGLGLPQLGYASPVRTVIELPNGDLIGGGFFVDVDAEFVGRWDGSAWGPIRAGTAQPVVSSAQAANGDVLVGGAFTIFEGVTVNGIARRVGGTWQALGGGCNGPVFAILPLPNGDVIVGGAFTAAGGVPAERVARWDGSAWQPLGAGLAGNVVSLARAGNDILAGGSFPGVWARWDGQSWSGTGAPGALASPSLVSGSNGQVYAHLGIVALGGVSGICRWNGAGWQPVAPTSGTGIVALLAVSNSGEPLGVFGAPTAARVRRWTGSAWVDVGGLFDRTVRALAVLPNGDLLAGGDFTANGLLSMQRLARWNGSGWSQVGSGVAGFASGVGSVAQLQWLESGRVVVGGSFTAVSGVPATSFAVLASNCPAAATAAGVGCNGSGGTNILTATSLPWTGASLTSRATGMPANGIALEVLGFVAPPLPLSTVFLQGLAGCVVSTTADVLRAQLATAGVVDLALALPNNPSLAGASFRQQVVPFELSPAGALIAVTATNALQLTIGTF